MQIMDAAASTKSSQTNTKNARAVSSKVKMSAAEQSNKNSEGGGSMAPITVPDVAAVPQLEQPTTSAAAATPPPAEPKAEPKAAEVRNASPAAKQNGVHTKIPLKRMTKTSSRTSTTTTTISTSGGLRKQALSVSRLSLAVRDSGNRRQTATNASRLTVGTATDTTRCKAVAAQTTSAKSLTARTTAAATISRRSASTICCNSLPGPKSGEGGPPSQAINVSRIPSAGDAASAIAAAPNAEAHNLSARERVAENNKLRVFENLQRKLEDMQSDFMQKFENLKLSAPEKLKDNYKFVTMVRSDGCRLLVKEDDLTRLPKKLPTESVAEFKEKIREAMDRCLQTLLDRLRLVQAVPTDYERSLNLEEIHDHLAREQARQLSELDDAVHVLCSGNNYDAQIINMQKEIQEGRKQVQTLERKLAELRVSSGKEVETLGRLAKERYESEVGKKDAQITELQKKLRSAEKQYEKLNSSVQQERNEAEKQHALLIEQLKDTKDSALVLTMNLQNVEHELKAERKENTQRGEACVKLEAELDSVRKRIEELSGQCKNDGSQQLRQKEVAELHDSLEEADAERQQLRGQLEAMKRECESLYGLNEKLQSAENRIQALQTGVNERECAAGDESTWPVEMQNELEKLRLSESDKGLEIQTLKMELSKAHFNICQLEEQIHRDQQLLEVRSELIGSLQSTDNNQRIHLEKMFAQVGDQNGTIHEVGLNNDLRTKTEEFRNLFATLSMKQMELSRQNHMIKLLEEGNDRGQMLRVKQEEKIGRLEEELTQLKQTISVYQNNVIGQTGKNLLFAPISSEECNENFYFYTTERRRKRQVDINVKKYQA